MQMKAIETPSVGAKHISPGRTARQSEITPPNALERAATITEAMEEAFKVLRSHRLELPDVAFTIFHERHCQMLGYFWEKQWHYNSGPLAKIHIRKANCACRPPRLIRVASNILRAAISCDACRWNFDFGVQTSKIGKKRIGDFDEYNRNI